MGPRRRSTPVYKRAIVPLDGSPFAEAVLPFFRQIAGPLDMEVMLLRVVAPSPLGPGVRPSFPLFLVGKSVCCGPRRDGRMTFRRKEPAADALPHGNSGFFR